MENGSAFVACSVNNTAATFAVVNYSASVGRIATSNAVTAGTYVISFIYLAA